MIDIQVETKDELTTSTGEDGLVEIWTQEIDNASSKERSFRSEARLYLDIYKNTTNNGVSNNSITNPAHPEGHNVFWSNTQTLRPLVFSNLPAPNVTRRFLDKDENSRIISEMMERSISFFSDEDDIGVPFNKSRDDFLITGRGLARVVLNPGEVVEIETKSIDKDSGEEVSQTEEELDIDTKKVHVQYVAWDDLRISPETVWEDVRWIAFRHKMNRDQLVDQFGERGKNVNLNFNILQNTEESNRPDNDIFKQAEVWEIWDKTKERIIFATIGGDGKILSEDEDNYNLKGFFPISKPLGSDSDPSDLVPIPLFRMYKAQADELNRLDARIRSLVEQIRFSGVYSSLAEGTNIESIMNGADGSIAPLKGLQPGVKISDQIEFKPIVDLVNVVVALRTQKADILQNIRDITGLSDIVRGTTLASETATAQKLKGDFAISRIQPLQKEFEIFIRNTIRLMSELIVENFTVEELAKITNLQIVDINLIAQATQEKQQGLFDEAMQQIDPNTPEGQQQVQQLEEQRKAGFEATMKQPLNDLKGYAVTPEQLVQIDAIMKNDKLRTFAVDVETDSTVRIDQNEHKAEMIEYVQAVSAYVSQMTPALQVGAINKEAFNQILADFSKAFKVGRNLEGFLLDDSQDEPEGPSVEEQVAQADNQRKDQELQLKAQEVGIKQQEVDIKKAQVKVNIEQFNDNLEFQDVNKEEDRRAKTLDQLVQDRTQRATAAIRESNLV